MNRSISHDFGILKAIYSVVEIIGMAFTKPSPTV